MKLAAKRKLMQEIKEAIEAAFEASRLLEDASVLAVHEVSPLVLELHVKVPDFITYVFTLTLSEKLR